MDRADWTYVSGLATAQWERLLNRRALLALLQFSSADERRARLRSSLLFADVSVVDAAPGDQVPDLFDALVRRFAAAGPDPRIADLFLLSRRWEHFRKFAKRFVLEEKMSADHRAHGVGEEDESFHGCFSGHAEDPRLRPFVQAAERIMSNLPHEGDRRGWMDHVVDAAEAGALIAAAQSLGSEVLLDWTRNRADLQAALSLLRARRLGWDMPSLLALWQEAGFTHPALAELALANDSAAPDALRQLGLTVSEGLLSHADAPVLLARQMDDRLTQLADASSGIPFGPERLFAFLWAVRNEAVNLRIILSAAAFGIPEERVAAELRGAHV